MMHHGLTEAQDELHQFMSDTSELAYYAKWMDGTEYRLWTFMSDADDDGEWGTTMLEPEVRSELLRLSDQIGGWICWGEAGPKYVAMADWQKAYRLWAGK